MQDWQFRKEEKDSSNDEDQIINTSKSRGNNTKLERIMKTPFRKLHTKSHPDKRLNGPLFRSLIEILVKHPLKDTRPCL